MATGFIEAQGDRSTVGVAIVSISANTIIGGVYTSPAGGAGAFTVTELGVYCDNSGGTATFRMALYKLDGVGDLDDYVAGSGTGSTKDAPGVPGWIEWDGLSITIDGSTDYAIVVWTDDDNNFDFEGILGSGAGLDNCEYKQNESGQYSWPDLAGDSNAFARELSIYAVYEAAAGAQEVSGVHISSGAALYPPAVAPGAVAVTGNTIASTLATYAASVAYAVGAATIASALSLASPSIAVGAVAVTGNHIASGLASYSPSVSVGAVEVTAAHVASGIVLTAPSVAPGAVAVTGNHIVSGLSLSAPSVSVGAVTITGVTIASGVGLNAPSVAVGAVAVTGATIASGLSLNAPSVTTGDAVGSAHISSTLALSAPSVSVGAVTVTGATITSGLSLGAPKVTTGAVTIGVVSVSAIIVVPSLGGAPDIGVSVQSTPVLEASVTGTPTIKPK